MIILFLYSKSDCYLQKHQILLTKCFFSVILFYVIEHRTIKGGVLRMKKSVTESVEIIKAKEKLGKKIKRLRESKENSMSLRKLSTSVGLPPSNMKYIEDGVNAPTAEIYDTIIQILKPNTKLHNEMDKLYTIIRGTPPPDICNIVCKNDGMNDVLRIIQNKELNAHQMDELRKLLTSFNTEPARGDNNNG